VFAYQQRSYFEIPTLSQHPPRRQCPPIDESDHVACNQGGALDCVFLITAPPPPPPPPTPVEEEEEAEAAEPPPEPSDEEKAEKEAFLAAGRAREILFVHLQDMCGVETAVGSLRSHKILADVCFDTLRLTATEPEAEEYCNAEVCDDVWSVCGSARIF